MRHQSDTTSLLGGTQSGECQKPITDPYELFAQRELGVTSYQRRWIINNDDIAIQKKLKSKISHVSYPERQVSKAELEKIMDPFWKTLCENKLLPLTTSFGYQNNHPRFNNVTRYLKEDNYIDIDRKSKLIDNLCLRLTQNF
jgi:hypothetical protein